MILNGYMTRQEKNFHLQDSLSKKSDKERSGSLESSRPLRSYGMVTGDHFPDITPVAQTLRETINKWDLLKLRSFCEAKGIVNKT